MPPPSMWAWTGTPRAVWYETWLFRWALNVAASHPPHLSDEELKLWFVELNYGRELAIRLRAYLVERHV